MSSNPKINFGFFNKEIDEIDMIEVDMDLNYDFHLEHDNLELIMRELSSLHSTFCILCQVKYKVNKTVIVLLLFRSLSPSYPEFLYTHLKRKYVNDTDYLLSGTLKQNILTLTPAFIRTLKANGMIGVCCISVKLLREKITTWMNEKRYLSDVLTTDVFGYHLLQYLSDKDLSKLRLVSKETKRMIDMKRPPIIFDQRKLPDDFEYTPESIDYLCSRYGRNPKDCALHIVYDIDRIGRIVQPLLDRRILAQSDIKLSIIITCGNNSRDNERNVFSSLCSILEDLQNTIYSLEIDLRDLYLIGESYLKVARVLSKIPNLRILKLSNGYIQWQSFLPFLKGITTLEELDLSYIHMLTDSPYSDLGSDDTDFDVEYFKDMWSESLKHLKRLRIAGKSILSYNERAGDDNELDLVETILPCLQDFTQLRSFGCTADPTEDYTNMERFIRFLPLLNLTKLDLSGSNLANFIEAESVAKILYSLPNLRELDLSNCYLDMRFFEIILPAIQNLKKLRYLDVSNNEDFSHDDIKQIKEDFKDLLFLDTHIDGQEEYQDLDELN